MAKTDTRYLSEVLTDARDYDLGSWLTKVTVADILPHNPISNGYLIPLPKTSVLSIRAQDYIVVKWNKKRRDASFMFCVVTHVKPVVNRGKVSTKKVILDLEHTETYERADGVFTHSTAGWEVSDSGYGSWWCVYDVVKD